MQPQHGSEKQNAYIGTLGLRHTESKDSITACNQQKRGATTRAHTHTHLTPAILNARGSWKIQDLPAQGRAEKLEITGVWFSGENASNES